MTLGSWQRLLLPMLLGLLLAGCSAADSLPPVLYLSPDAEGAVRLHLKANAAAEALLVDCTAADGAGDVVDFAVAPDGRTIACAYERAEGSAIAAVEGERGTPRPILDCPDAECTGLIWAPDGRRLVYERRPLVNGAAGQPRLYWLDSATGETVPLIAAADSPSYGARFSPDGAWITYVSPQNEGVVLSNLAGGAQRLLPSRAGQPAAWSPDSRWLLLADLAFQTYDVSPGTENNSGGVVQETSSVYLYRVAADRAGSRERISPESSVEDSGAAWSPDGEWIAFRRAFPGTGAGRQLWLMRPDGSDARALESDHAYTYGPPAWSPDGQHLLYQRYALDGGAALPEVWLLDLTTGERQRVAADGFQPAWLSAMVTD